ncbi:MAG: TIGR01212 family radical SAM protein [Epulopiscium sp. Nele67-Bin004]|nr:MAG: TIGR01212 family radical SAM protein [Epulopiscium sp. Nele67-Bin004]
MYNKYSDYLKNKYGEKVYKIPIDLGGTCPNRDGTSGHGGCTFCGDDGVGYETHKESITDQINRNIQYISKRYKAKYFIGYLQNYSNTYMKKEQLENVLSELRHPDFVGISISTRPDCISDEYLQIIKNYQNETNLDVCIELGLQTANYKSLEKINRGHGLAEFIDATLRVKRFGFSVCAHLILNLPWDDEADVIENAKLMSALQVDFVKLHALYIVKNTTMCTQYENNEIEMITEEQYKQRVILFLRYLSKDIVMQRIIGRVPEEFSVFANWGTSWWKIHDDIVEAMQNNNYEQGDLCDYLNGKALKNMV